MLGKMMKGLGNLVVDTIEFVGDVVVDTAEFVGDLAETAVDMTCDAIDDGIDKYQGFTGEKDRKQIIEEIKVYVTNHEEEVETRVFDLNTVIGQFNYHISDINFLRQAKIKSDLQVLYGFLDQFGDAPLPQQYAHEFEKEQEPLPVKELEEKRNYVNEIDKSDIEIFLRNFLLTPFGAKLVNKKQNFTMRETFGHLKLEGAHAVEQLKNKQLTTEFEKEIARLYLSILVSIINTIDEEVIPELQRVEAFMQANKIKNQIIAGRSINNTNFSTDIQWVQGTIYEKHYFFVKNTFCFYIMACKMYDTPVLTRLLTNTCSSNDKYLLQEHQKCLQVQNGTMKEFMIYRK